MSRLLNALRCAVPLIVTLSLPLPGQQETSDMRLRPGMRDDVVGCGVFQLSGYDDRLDGIACPDLAGHKLMKKWAILEPQEGVFRWEVLDQPIQKIRAAGKRFMISPIIPDGGVPQWVYEAGATWIGKAGADAEHPVDGTNFYLDVLVQGEVKVSLRHLQQELKWHPESQDLTPFAGQDVVLRLSTDCGTRAYYDSGLWGRPRVVRAVAPGDPLVEAADSVYDIWQHCDSATTYIVVDGKRLPLGQRARFEPRSDWACGGVTVPSIHMHPPWNDADGNKVEGEPKRLVAEFPVKLPDATPGRSLWFSCALGIHDVPPECTLGYRFPVYWHPVLRDKYRQFIAALGKRYDGEAGLEVVYAGTGTYGESIISPDLWPGWETEKAQEWRRAGLTEEAWVGYVNEIVDAYAAAFPHTPVGLQISNSGLPDNERVARTVAEHAAAKGVLIQYDGAMGQPFKWGGGMYVDVFKPLAKQTSWGLETYGPSPGAGGVNWTGDFADFVDCIAKHAPSYALAWYQDVVKATPGSQSYDPEWARQMKRCREAVRPGPSTHEVDSSWRTVWPPVSDRILFNPGMGLFVMNWGAKEDQWWTEVADIVYVRDSWSGYEPEEGTYQFEKLDAELARWKTAGKRVAFRVMHSCPNSRNTYVTPRWVFDAGAKVITLKRPEKDLTEPVIWDPIFLKKYKAFVHALGERYDGMDGLEFVDIPIGAYGEMWLNGPRVDWLAAGYSDDLFIETAKKIIDIYKDAFRHTPLFIPTSYPWAGNLAENPDRILNQTFDYMVRNGVNLRHDGLSLPWSGWFDPRAKQYNRQVSILWEFWGGWKDMRDKGWDVRKVMDRGLDSGMSYLALMGAAEVAGLDEATRAEIRTTAKRIGYRFVIDEVRLPSAINAGAGVRTRVPVRIRWRNAGVAPCYASFKRAVYLTAADGTDALVQQEYPVVPTSQWWPGQVVDDGLNLDLPESFKPGSYRLLVALAGANPARAIKLGLDGEDSQGRYLVAQVEVTPRPPGRVSVPKQAQSDFETGENGWQAAPGMTVARLPDAAHDGALGACVSGEQRDGWWYAATASFPLLPEARYRLCAWVRLQDPLPAKMPGLKASLQDAAGKHLVNCATTAAAAIDAWQELTTEFWTPAGTVSAFLALEKMTKEPLKATIRFDSVRVELLELTAPQ